jgi:hypothetical protein
MPGKKMVPERRSSLSPSEKELPKRRSGAFCHNNTPAHTLLVVLGGVLVIVLATGPRFAGSTPAESYGCLSVIKVRSMTPFGGEVTTSVLVIVMYYPGNRLGLRIIIKISITIADLRAEIRNRDLPYMKQEY